MRLARTTCFLSLLLLSLVGFNTGALWAQCLPAGSYTINSGLPPGNGNYQSFNDAVAAMACGIQGPVTFTVAYGSGPYTEQVTIPPIPGAGPSARVVFDGQHQDSTLLRHNGQGIWATLLLNKADYIEIRNLTVQNTSLGAGFGIQLTDTADHNIIRNTKVLLDVANNNTNSCGIVASASLTSPTAEGNTANFLLIDSVTVVGGYGGIRLEGRSTSLLKQNRITNCHISATFNFGILTDDTDSLIILNNIVRDLRDEGADGIHLTDPKNRFEVMGNQVYVPDWGLFINVGVGSTANRGMVGNNFVYSTGDYAFYLLSCERLNIWHNTFVSGTVCARWTGTNKKLDVRNNIFYSLTNFALENNAVDTLGHYDAINYNIYYTHGPELIKSGGTAASFVYVTLADWVNAVPFYNSHSIQGSPLFYGPTDLHLLDTLANNKGDNTASIPWDIDGQARPMAPSTRVDIGADEYEPFTNNIGIAEILSPQAYSCGDSTLVITAVLHNQGVAAQTGFNVAATVTGPNGTQTILTQYTGTLAPWTFDTIIIGTVNTYQGGTFNILVQHLLANDEYPVNDTLSLSRDLLARLPYPTVVSDTVCVGQTAELFADGTGFTVLDWFADAAATSNIGAGDTYFTPTLSATETYYVRGQQGSLERAGKLAPSTSPANPFISVSPGWGLEFAVERTVYLDSVTLYPTSNGDFSVVVYPATGGNAVYTSQVLTVSNANGGPVQYYLGALLDRGQYIIGMATANGVEFLRDQPGSGVSYPYTSPSGYVRIVGNKQGFAVAPLFTSYYWFYDWVIRIPSCYSTLAPVVAFVSDSLSDAGNDVDICIGETATLAAENGVAWSWNNGETTQNIQVSPASSTSYNLTITDANGCPGRPGTVTVNVNPLPVVSAGADTAVCAGNTASLLATGAASYVWSNGTTAAANGVTVAGDYIVTGTDGNGCVAADTVAVSHLALPVVSAGADQAICLGDTANFVAIGADSYIWSNGVTGTSIEVSVADDYVVTGTDANGCSAADTVTLAVNPLPAADAGVDRAICIGDSTDLRAMGGFTYQWSTGETAALITVSPGNTATYSLTATDQNNCSAVASVVVTVNPLPTVAFSVGDTLCDTQQEVVLNASPVGGTFYGPGVVGDTFRFQGLALPDSYTLVYDYTDANGCSATAQEEVFVDVCLGMGEIAALSGISVYPNPFSGILGIEFTAIDSKPITISFFDLVGRKLYANTFEVTLGQNTHISLPLGDVLSEGIYIIEIQQQQVAYRQQVVLVK